MRLPAGMRGDLMLPDYVYPRRQETPSSSRALFLPKTSSMHVTSP